MGGQGNTGTRQCTGTARAAYGDRPRGTLTPPCSPASASGLCPSGAPTLGCNCLGAEPWLLHSSPRPPGRTGPPDMGELETPQLLQQPKTQQHSKTSMVSDPTAAPWQPQALQHCGSSGAPSLKIPQWSGSLQPGASPGPSSIPGPHSTTGLPSAHPNRGKPQEMVPEGDFTGTHQTPCPPQLMFWGPRGKLQG